MKERKAVYCEFEFLQKFLKQRPTMLEPNDESIRQMQGWMSMYKFICKSDLIINVSNDEFRKLCSEDSWLAMLWKKSTQGECGLEFETENFVRIGQKIVPKTDEAFLNAVFLSDAEKSECESFSKAYGVFAINGEVLMNCTHLYKDDGCSFPSEKAKDWNFLSALNSCTPRLDICNSLIIVDNYLFESNQREVGEAKRETSFSYEDKLDYNLKPILDCLLPKVLAEDIIFEITIISGRSGVNYKAQYNYVCSIIGKIRPRLNYKLSFYNDASIFHDRCIVSNNVWISCGHGFDVFKKDGGSPSKSTTVNVVFPFIQSEILWVDGSFLNLMRDIKKIVLRYNEEGRDYWGNNLGKCRMLNYYSKQNEEKHTTENLVQMNSSPINIGKAKFLGKMDLSLLNRGTRR